MVRQRMRLWSFNMQKLKCSIYSCLDSASASCLLDSAQCPRTRFLSFCQFLYFCQTHIFEGASNYIDGFNVEGLVGQAKQNVQHLSPQKLNNLLQYGLCLLDITLNSSEGWTEAVHGSSSCDLPLLPCPILLSRAYQHLHIQLHPWHRCCYYMDCSGALPSYTILQICLGSLSCQQL